MDGNFETFAAKALRETAGIHDWLGGESVLYAKLRKELPKVTIDGQIYHVAEGDTLLDDDQLLIYASSRQKVAEARQAMMAADAAGLGLQSLSGSPNALIGITQGGKIVRWQPGLTLSYRVIRATFTNAAHYDAVVANMRAATQAWEDTCGIAFEHRQHLDSAPGTDAAGALFAVRQIDAGGSFIASAFFPNDPIDRRRVLIDPSYYGTSFDRVGVLRHELGHVLGFRHEHISSHAPAVCPNESEYDTVPLTQYDPTSVMHYFCGGVGSQTLAISDLDRIGAQKVYGPPLAALELVA